MIYHQHDYIIHIISTLQFFFNCVSLVCKPPPTGCNPRDGFDMSGSDDIRHFVATICEAVTGRIVNINNNTRRLQRSQG